MLSAAPALAQTPTLDSEEWAFLTLINNYRAQNGVGPLQVSAALENSSRWMSNDMATKNYFSHTDSLGRDPFTRMKAFNYTYTPAGENIAAGTLTSNAQTAFNQWLNACDPDGSGNCTYAHRENMRYPGYVVIGIARAYNSASMYSWYWTTDFGGFLDQTVSPTNSISGRVTLAGAGLGGIAVALSGSSTATTTTDSSGNFTFNGLAGGGNYTVTPSSSAYVFTPAAQSFSNLSGNQTLNFAATAASGPPVLSVVMSHAGNFTQGQAGATYTITVSNAPTGPTSGVVTVTELLPSGLALVSMAGSGWSCTGATCTRSDVLNPGASYPSITVTVNVASNAASQITNQVTVSGGGSGSTSAADATNILPLPVALGFYPVTPCRVADTRSFGGKTGAFGPPFLPRGSSRDFPILSGSCGIPATALAYSLNVTVSPHGPLGFLSIWPAGSPFPVVSTLNSFDGSVVANAAIVPAGASGAVSVYASDDTDVFLDINGYFAPPTAQALAFYPVTPCRVADTRSYGGKTGAFGPPTLAPFETRTFPVSSSSCGVPSSAQAYSFNLTAWPSGPLQYLSTWPAGQAQPFVSTLNAYGGGLVANAAIVPAGAGGSISVFVTDRSDVIMDINGYFAPPGPGGLYFYPVTPCRVADTRSYGGKSGSFGPPQLPASGTRAFPVPAGACGITTAAQAYALNMTAWPTGPLGFLTTWPAGQSQPVVSTLNSLTGKVVANAAIVPAGANGGINVYVSNPADVFFDINGYFAP